MLDPRLRALAPRLALPLATTTLVVSAGRLGTTAGQRPPSWFGLLAPAGGAGWAAALAATVVGLVLLVAGWLLVCHDAATRRLRRPTVWRIFAASVAPLLVGPPLFSHDPYSYAAQGALTLRRLGPYVATPEMLGNGPLLQAVDPMWRDVHAPYGPVALAWNAAAAALGGQHVMATVVVLRLFAVAAVVGALRMGPPDLIGRRQSTWLPLLALNPITLIYLVSTAHNDALVALLVAAAVAAVRRDRVVVAGAALALAGAVKFPALLALPAVVAVGAPAGVRPWLGRLARAGAGVAAVWGVIWAALPHAFGWVSAVGVPDKATTPWAPSTMAAYVMWGIAWPARLGLSWPGALAAGRVLGLVAAVGLAGLALTGPRRGTLAAVGWTLVGAALAAPVVYPWYLAWGMFTLPTSSWWRRDWLAAVVVVLSISVAPVPTPATVVLDVLAVACWAGVRGRRLRMRRAPTVRGPWLQLVEGGGERVSGIAAVDAT